VRLVNTRQSPSKALYCFFNVIIKRCETVKALPRHLIMPGYTIKNLNKDKFNFKEVDSKFLEFLFTKSFEVKGTQCSYTRLLN